jgi:hypothetical protein
VYASTSSRQRPTDLLATDGIALVPRRHDSYVDPDVAHRYPFVLDSGSDLNIVSNATATDLVRRAAGCSRESVPFDLTIHVVEDPQSSSSKLVIADCILQLSSGQQRRVRHLEFVITPVGPRKPLLGRHFARDAEIDLSTTLSSMPMTTAWTSPIESQFPTHRCRSSSTVASSSSSRSASSPSSDAYDTPSTTSTDDERNSDSDSSSSSSSRQHHDVAAYFLQASPRPHSPAPNR